MNLVKLGDDHKCDESVLVKKAAMLILKARNQNPENGKRWQHYNHVMDTLCHIEKMRGE